MKDYPFPWVPVPQRYAPWPTDLVGAVRRFPEAAAHYLEHLERERDAASDRTTQQAERAERAEELLAQVREACDAECVTIGDITAERQRQIEVEGWTPEHDDEHDEGDLALAAACYAIGTPDPLWPWEARWWKPTTTRRDLVKAGALIVAEIERLDRRDGVS